MCPWRALNGWRPTDRPRTLVTDEGTRSEARVVTVVLAGEPVLGKNVALLATMLDDHPLAQRLKRGLAQRNSIVMLTSEDREMLIVVLKDPPSGLAGLQSTLLRQQRMPRRLPPNF